MNIRRFCVLLLPALTLSGCVSISSFKGIPVDDGGVFVSGVPPIKQDGHYACGASCVAAVAAYWNVSLADFRAKHPAMHEDATGADLQALAESLGLRAFAYRGSMTDLEENLRKGRPLIVMIPKPTLPSGGMVTAPVLNAWNEMGPRPPHWVVVVGLTKEHAVILQDPASGSLVVKDAAFRAWWAKKDNLTVLIAAR